MPESLLLPVSLTLFAILVSAGVLLRVTASIVQNFATRPGTPHLATGVKIIGVSFIGLGLSLAVIAGLFALLEAATGQEVIVTACAFLVAWFLVFSGAFLWRWAMTIQALPSEEFNEPLGTTVTVLVAALLGPVLCPPLFAALPIRTVESGTTKAVLLSWIAGLLSVALCLAAVFEPWIIVLMFPLELACLSVLAVMELVLWWNRCGHRQILRLWQMYLAVHSRRPLAEEVQFLSDYAWGAERRRLLDVCEELHEGGDVEDAFIRPMMLSNLEGAQVAVGMKAGKLPQVLRDMLERRTALSNDLLGMQDRLANTVYAWILLTVLFDVVGFIMYYIIPKFKKIFDDFGTDLPQATKAVIRLSDAFVNYWYLIVPLILLLLTGHTLVSVLPFARSFPRLRVWFARLWPRVCMPDVLRSLALATEAKLPLEEALVPFVRRQFQIPLHSRLVRVQEAVREGGDCWIVMADENLLTPTEASLLRSAQRSDNLPWALNSLSRQFEQRWYFRMLFWLEFFHPVLLIAVAIVVGFIVIGFFLPLVKLINDLS